MLKRIRCLLRPGEWIAALCMAVLLLPVLFPDLSIASRGQAAGASGGTTLYLPIVAGFPFDLTDVWTREALGEAQIAFLSGGALVYQLSGITFATEPVVGFVEITETGPCGAGLVFGDFMSFPSGSWQKGIPAPVPSCPGIYTSSITLTHGSHSETLEAKFVVNDAFQQQHTSGQGFDRCVPPSVGQLATWWDESPYSVINIYLGGIHYPQFCQTGIQDAFWVHEVAAQGWSFTAVWVGPQPPCSNFTHKMSPVPEEAYLEGREEAAAAAQKARTLGLFGDIPIHYDIEGYSGTTPCRTVVRAFLQGWTDQLHELELKAGSYGGGCSSFITDWSTNDPIIDQVWIAHWQLPAVYNPDATVWDAACVSNFLWANHQRIKQYAGDHVETWGGTTITIDSNVFGTSTIGQGTGAAGNATMPTLTQAFGSLGGQAGWLLAGGRLYRTDSLGAAWQEITPVGLHVLGADFLDPENGWVAGWLPGETDLVVGRTEDGGASWRFSALDPGPGLVPATVAAAFPEVLDDAHLWLALKLQSGSSFSLGLLYASADGGATWEPRSHPLGEPVRFEDAQVGWTLGGPDGNAAYRTLDGGLTWSAVDPAAIPAHLAGTVTAFGATLPQGAVAASEWEGAVAWVLVQEGGCTGEKNAQVCELTEQIWMTVDGGASWRVIPHPADGPAGSSSPEP